MKPYTYLLHHKPTNTFYYGVRFAKNCHPDEFWVTYFTSSKKQIPLLRTLFGDDSFEFKIRKTFESVEKARNWESKVLRRMKVLKKPDIWINRTDNKAILNEIQPWTGKKLSKEHRDKIKNNSMGNKSHLGHKHSKESREKISKSKIGKIPWNKNTKGVMKAWNKGTRGLVKDSEKTKELKRNAIKQLYWVNNGIVNKRRKIDDIEDGFVFGKI